MARVAVPAVVAGVLVSGVAIAAWPHAQPLTAVPAPATGTAADAVRTGQSDRTTRNQGRPSLSPTPSSTPSATESGRDDKSGAGKPKAKHPTKNRAKPSADTSASPAAPTAVPSQTPQPQPAPSPPRKLDLQVIGTRYTTTALNVRTAATTAANVVTTLQNGSTVEVTKTVQNGWRLINRAGQARWVKDQYLSDTKPKASATTAPKASASTAAGGLSSAPCASGSAVESGLTPDAIRVHRAVCARFPQVRAFGGRRGGGGYHASGQAVDCMISNSAVGWEIANWVRANARRLGVSEVIYSQRIWTVQRGGDGWRGMSDRGSATANHYDHVHVSVYGNSGTG